MKKKQEAARRHYDDVRRQQLSIVACMSESYSAAAAAAVCLCAVCHERTYGLSQRVGLPITSHGRSQVVSMSSGRSAVARSWIMESLYTVIVCLKSIFQCL